MSEIFVYLCHRYEDLESRIDEVEEEMEEVVRNIKGVEQRLTKALKDQAGPNSVYVLESFSLLCLSGSLQVADPRLAAGEKEGSLRTERRCVSFFRQ